jgi:hypothetical protein
MKEYRTISGGDRHLDELTDEVNALAKEGWVVKQMQVNELDKAMRKRNEFTSWCYFLLERDIQSPELD